MLKKFGHYIRVTKKSSKHLTRIADAKCSTYTLMMHVTLCDPIYRRRSVALRQVIIES